MLYCQIKTYIQTFEGKIIQGFCMLELYIVRKMYNKSIFIEKELPY